VIKFFQTQILPSKPVQLLIQTVWHWQQDDCLEMGAALAYYALFSLFPICLVMLSLLGWLLGPKTDNYSQLLTLAKNALPPEPYQIVQETLLNLNQSSLGAGLIGFFLLLLTASKIFEALTRSVNKVWKLEPRSVTQSGLKNQIVAFFKDKILAFLLVLSTVLVFLLSMLSNLILQIVMEIINHFHSLIPWLKLDDLLLFKSVQASISYLMIATVIMALFKVLPSCRITWQSVWLGALLTTLLLMLLQNFVSNGIIRIGESFQAYGVIGNVMVLLLWIYLIFQIFFLGCEFSYVYTQLIINDSAKYKHN
jgi:membrane protein